MTSTVHVYLLYAHNDVNFASSYNSHDLPNTHTNKHLRIRSTYAQTAMKKVNNSKVKYQNKIRGDAQTAHECDPLNCPHSDLLPVGTKDQTPSLAKAKTQIGKYMYGMCTQKNMRKLLCFLYKWKIARQIKVSGKMRIERRASQKLNKRQ